MLQTAAAHLPGPAKRAVQVGLEAIDSLVVRAYRRRTGYVDPIPGVMLRARVGGPRVDVFVDSSRNLTADIEEAVAAAGRSFADFRDVLDFGCGCGRVLMPLARAHPSTTFHGCDIDVDAIGWLGRHHPTLSVEVNSFEPALPYADATFDLLYSVSVLTHLDEESQFRWLREIRRVLAPDGLALVTVHGERAFQGFSKASGVAVANERIAAHGSLAQSGFVFESAAPSHWSALEFIHAEDAWGLAFHSPEYIRDRWGEIFTSTTLLERPGLQDVVVLAR